MTIDEAIKHAEEVAEENENNAQIWHKQTKNRLVDFCDRAIQAENNCIKCAEEHRQLAEWLKELKRYHQAKDGLLEDMKALNCGFPFGLDYLISCIEKRLQEVKE